MKATCALIVGLLMVVGSANAAVLLEDDFESGYSDGSLIGQMAPNGETWKPHAGWQPGPINRGDYGKDSSKGASGSLIGTTTSSIIPFGRRVTSADPDNIVVVSADMTAGEGHNIDIEIVMGDGSAEWNWLKLLALNDAENAFGSMGRHAGPDGYVDGSGAGNLGDPGSDWYHAEATIDLAAGEADFVVYAYGDPGTLYTYTGSWAGVYDFQPDGLHVMSNIWANGNPDVLPGVDNLYVETIPEPATLCLLGLGGLTLLRRRRFKK